MKYFLTYFLALATLLGTSTLSAQTFTNVVDQRVESHEEFNYNYKNGSLPVTNSLAFFMTFSDGSATNIYGKLIHQDRGEVIFSGIASTNPELVVQPIDGFYGTKQGSEWKLYFRTSSPLTVHSWGISTIPEPSVLVLTGLTMVSFLFFRRHRE